MIPKKIHYCWFGGNPKPKLAEKCIKSWKKLCPDYEIIEWNEDNYDCRKSTFMREAYEAKKWGFVPDYARLDIIYNHGGIYLDTDVELIRPIDDLLEYSGYIGFETNQYLNLGQGFAAESGNEIIRDLLSSYEERHFLNPDGSYDMTPSPRCDSAVLEKKGVVLNGEMQEIDGFVFLPSDYLNPIAYDRGAFEVGKNTRSIHWYMASWLPEKKRKQSQTEIRNIILHHYLSMPKRMGRKLLGDDLYEKIKGIIRH